jgi:hypothetical protein
LGFTVTTRDWRALTFGGVVVLLAIVTTRVIPAGWRSASQSVSELQIRTDLLARERAEIRDATALEDSGAKIKTRVVALAPRILPGNGPAEAMANLTNRVSVAAASQRVRIERTTPIGDSIAAGALRRVSLRVAITGDTRGTLGLLAALARGPVVLTAYDLRIVAPDPGTSSNVAEALQSEFTLRGWYQQRERGQ